MKKRIIICITFIMILVAFIVNSYAANNKLTINYELNGTKFKVYDMHVFDIYGVDYKSKDITTLLVSLITRNNIKETYSGVIKNNKLEINLDDGYYLITGDSYVDDKVKYTVMPSIIKVTKDLDITPKYEKDKVEPFELSVFKSWVDDKNTHDEIKVTLYENGKEKETVSLNSKNGFKYTFKNLNRKNEYTIFEENIPKGYSLNIVKNDDVLTLVNTATTPTPTPSVTPPGSSGKSGGASAAQREKLPQTGQPQYPILYCLILGIICIVISFMKYRKVFLTAAIILLTIATILLLNNETESLEAQNASNITVNQIIANFDEEVTDITEDIPLITEVPEMDTIEIDGIEYIGTLEIPSQDILLPVASDWSMDTLKISLCRYSGSIFTDDLVICGHNFSRNRHFGVLKHLEVGDKVYFRDVNNQTVEYRVVLAEVLDPYDLNGMKNSDYDLTLFTCTYGGGQRLAIRCNRFVQK